MQTKLGLAVQRVQDVYIHFYEAPIGPIFQQGAGSILRAIPLSKTWSRNTFQVMGDPWILLTFTWSAPGGGKRFITWWFILNFCNMDEHYPEMLFLEHYSTMLQLHIWLATLARAVWDIRQGSGY